MKEQEIRVPKINRSRVPGKIIFEVIVGSHLHLTYNEKSDVDIKGVYTASETDVLCGTVKKTTVISDDIVYYEIGHFMSLLEKGNPTVIEMIFAPNNYITLASTTFKEVILNRKMMFVKANFGNSVIGTVNSHMKHVKIDSDEFRDINQKTSLKMQSKPERYCRVIDVNFNLDNNRTLLDFLSKQSNPGQSNINNYAIAKMKGFGDIYKIYYDRMGTFAKGIFDEEGNIIEHIVPHSYIPVALMYYDKEKFDKENSGFISAWKKFNEITKNDNYVPSTFDGHKILYDAKKMMNSMRLLDTAIEFYKKKIMRVSRVPENEYYRSIKENKHSFKNLLLDLAERKKCLVSMLKTVKQEAPQKLLTRHLLIQIRSNHPTTTGSFYKKTNIGLKKNIKSEKEHEEEIDASVFSQWTD